MSKRERILRAAVTAIARGGARGLRVEQIAADAGVSMGLIYHHFANRAGLMRATFAYIDAAITRTNEAAQDAAHSPRERLVLGLLAELSDAPEAREYALAWNELRASAVFEDALREPLAASTRSWCDAIAGEVRAAAPHADAAAVAQRLTALVEGLGMRRASGTSRGAHAEAQLRAAIDAELHVQA